MKVIPLAYQKNVRDLGGLIGFNGKKVKHGRIYRGGHLIKVSDEDVKLINSLKLTDIIDFRSAEEYVKRPEYKFMGVTYHNLPSMPSDDYKGLQNNNKYEDSNLLWFLQNKEKCHRWHFFLSFILKNYSAFGASTSASITSGAGVST